MSSTAQANRQIARAAGTVMLAFVLGQVISLVAKILVTEAFGTGPESEAFFAANRFSEIIFNLVAGGALGSAFIPTFTTLLEQDKRAGAWRLASAVANLVTLALVIVCIFSAIFAEQVVRNLLVPGFISDPVKEALTVRLLRIQLPSAAIFGLSGLVMGILNAHRKFLLAALTPTMYWGGWIVGALVFAPLWGIDGLGLGVVLGSLLHLALQFPALLRLPGRQYKPTLGLQDQPVREVARLMAPRLLGVAVVQLNFWLNTFLASSMPEGSVTGITLGFSLMLMPLAAIAQSVAVAALPTFSAQAARGELPQMRSSLAASLRGVLLLAVPASFGLALLSTPLVGLLYQHGEFGPGSTALVAWALLWYAVGLVGHSLVEIASRGFYALHNTQTPVLVGVGAMSLNLLLSLLVPPFFTHIGWAPHGGLALANTVATLLESLILLALLRKRLDGLDGRRILNGFTQALLAALVMTGALAGWLELTQGWSFAIQVLGGVLLGGGVYGLVVWILRVPEIRQLVGLTLRRFRKNRG